VSDDPFDTWFKALEARHLADLRFAEVRRGLQALSALYVERRGRLASGTVFDGAGKRAAFALFYGPLHFLLVRSIARSLEPAAPPLSELVDLGCGTGAAGAAWALDAGAPRILGVERNPWAAGEARWTWASLGLEGQIHGGSLDRVPLPGMGGAVLAAFTVNELGLVARVRLLARLLDAGRRGARLLVLEPLARRALPWWDDWEAAFTSAGGRSDEWRFPARLPETLSLLDKAAGLRHIELAGRSLYLYAPAGAVPAEGSERAQST